MSLASRTRAAWAALRTKPEPAPLTEADIAATDTGPLTFIEGQLRAADPADGFKPGVQFEDRRVDVALPVCPSCGNAIEGRPHIAEDGLPRHERCSLHDRLGCMGDSAEATHCAVCGQPLATV